MRYPDWMGIGTQKSGTSWAYVQIARHPQVKVPTIEGVLKKEFHVFDTLSVSLRQYFRILGKIPNKYKTGEYTPGYFSVPYAPCLISEFCPDAKLFTIFRNPVDRAFSHYKDHLFLNKIPFGTTFRDAFEWDYPKNEQKYATIKERGLYAKHLRNWYAYFDSKQIKIMWYDDMVKDPINFIRELYDWIGVNTNFLPKKYKEYIVKDYNVAYDDMKLEEKDREFVRDFYTEEIKNLGEMTKKDLSVWLSPRQTQ